MCSHFCTVQVISITGFVIAYCHFTREAHSALRRLVFNMESVVSCFEEVNKEANVMHGLALCAAALCVYHGTLISRVRPAACFGFRHWPRKWLKNIILNVFQHVLGVSEKQNGWCLLDSTTGFSPPGNKLSHSWGSCIQVCQTCTWHK